MNDESLEVTGGDGCAKPVPLRSVVEPSSTDELHSNMLQQLSLSAFDHIAHSKVWLIEQWWTVFGGAQRRRVLEDAVEYLLLGVFINPCFLATSLARSRGLVRFYDRPC